MIIHKIMDRMLAGQMLLFDGWIQIDNEEIYDAWWNKGDLNLVVRQVRPYGIHVFEANQNFTQPVGKMYMCGNIKDFSNAIEKIKLR